VSNIDPTKPTYGKSYTSDVRQNFQFAKDEIELLQRYFGNGPWLPTSGGQMLGHLYLNNDPVSNVEAATKQYVDNSLPAGGPFLPLAGGTVSGTTTFQSSVLFGTNLAGTTNVRTHAAAANSATLQFYKGSTATTGHRWDITTGTDTTGGQLSALAYDDAGAQKAGAVFQASRYSGISNNGNPWWAIAPYTVGFARAVTPNENIGAKIGGGSGLIDTQPTSTLANNPLSTTAGFPNVRISWPGAGATSGGVVGAPYTTRETWVNITGATAVGGLTISGWYLAAPVDNNTITINVGTNATSTAVGGGSAVQITPSFGTNTTSVFSTATTSATTFPLQDVKLFVVNPAFYQPIGGKGPNYQQRWSQFITAPDKTGTNQFIHIGWEQDLCNRGGDFGYQPIMQAGTDPTIGIWMSCITAVPSYAAGGGVGENWQAGLVFGKERTGFYEAINIQPRTLVGAAVDPTGHGGVGLDFFGSYVLLVTDPFTTSAGSATVVVHPTGGAAIGQSNGDIFTLAVGVVVNGVTLAAGNYGMSNVNDDFFNIIGVGAATASGTGGGSGLYGYYPKQTPFAPAQWWGEWKHGITTTNAKFDSGGIIETQPGNGILWSDGAGTASVNSTASSRGNIDVVITPAGTGRIKLLNLPTSNTGLQPGTLWNNGGFLCIA
jgi:hypothetical protein